MESIGRSPILIDGASGYIGSHLAFHLNSRGYSVRCLVRPETAQGNIDFLRSFGADVVMGNLGDNTSAVSRAFADCQSVVHLIGSIAPRKGESYGSLHEEMTTHLVYHCKQNKVDKVVMVSSLGASPRATNQYHLTKWQAEEVLRSSGLKHIILQPSLIVGRLYGTRDSKLVKRYIDLVTYRKMVPLINGGINKIQPIFVMDLVKALANCLDVRGQQNGTYELGGSQIVTMRGFVEELMKVLGVNKPIISVPVWLAEIIACLSESIQEVPVLSRAQVRIALQHNICQRNDLEEVFGVRCVSYQEALKTYNVNREAESVRI